MEQQNIEELIKQEQRDYHREWRRNNPEKVRARNAAYWQRRVEKKQKGLLTSDSQEAQP